MPLPRKTLLSFILLLGSSTLYAQDKWATPELSQMYAHAQEFVVLKNYKEAITILKQALLLDPGKLLLSRELGKTQYLSGDYDAAVNTLKPLTANTSADTLCYQLLAACYAAQQNTRDALSVLKKGLHHFPSSGLLYYETGKMYTAQGNPKAALNAWLDGIQNAPAYPQNYYEAARIYLASGEVIWGLLYGETFINITTDSTGRAEIKTMLVAASKTLFEKIATGRKEKGAPSSFSASIQQVFTSLTPVVSDGITTENLTMVRTRFLMDWPGNYGSRYPYSLFTYHDYLLRNGLFEIYNEWLFGNAINTVEYTAWNQFHPGEIDLLLQKLATHPLVTSTSDFYNERDINAIFPKKGK